MSKRRHFWMFLVLLTVVLAFALAIYIAGSRLGGMVGPSLRDLESASSP
jgi:hypothetical protein